MEVSQKVFNAAHRLRAALIDEYSYGPLRVLVTASDISAVHYHGMHSGSPLTTAEGIAGVRARDELPDIAQWAARLAVEEFGKLPQVDGKRIAGQRALDQLCDALEKLGLITGVLHAPVDQWWPDDWHPHPTAKGYFFRGWEVMSEKELRDCVVNTPVLKVHDHDGED